jgi:hypothetical protein
MKIEKFDITSLDDGVFIGNVNKSFPLRGHHHYSGSGYVNVIEIDFPYSNMIKQNFEEEIVQRYNSVIDQQIIDNMGFNTPYNNPNFLEKITPLYHQTIRQVLCCLEGYGIESVNQHKLIEFQWEPEVYVYVQTEKKSYNFWHHHQKKGPSVSSTFYLNVPEDGGEIKFKFAEEEINIKVEENKLYLFPSWLYHVPAEHTGDNTRVCINADFYTPNRPFLKGYNQFW